MQAAAKSEAEAKAAREELEASAVDDNRFIRRL